MSATMPEGLGGELILASSEYRRSRRKWLEARRSGLGASDTAAVLGVADFADQTPLVVWQSKVATGPAVDAAEESEPIRWGNVLEHPVARETARQYPEIGKIIPTPGLLAHPEHRWLLATVDRPLVPRGSKSGRVQSLLEVKTTSRDNYRAKWLDGVPPTGIQVQVQQQLAVTGLEFAFVTVLVGGQHLPEPVRIERHEGVIEQLIAYAGPWWQEHVVGGVRPEPTFNDHKRLPSLWGADDALDAVTADDDLEEQVARWLDAKRREKEAAEEKELLAFRLKTAMRERTAIKTSDREVLVTWKEQQQTKFDKRGLAAAHPELVERFTTRGTTRVLREKGKRS